jgi:hypothetical protein
MKQLIDDYFSIKQKIHDAFGYVENWVVIPLEDNRDYYWVYQEGDDDVLFAEKEEHLRDASGGEYYSNSIYRQRFLNKYVYEANGYTMICCDTQVDGNKFLCIFDNAKKITLTEKELDTYW